MNESLLQTSILFALFYTAILVHYWNPQYTHLYIATLIGFATSICNHGDLIPCACPIDRFYMTILAIIYLYTFFTSYIDKCIKASIIISVLNMGLLYIYSKVTNQTEVHRLLHLYAFLFVSIIAIILYRE